MPPAMGSISPAVKGWSMAIGCLLSRVTGVDQCQPVVALDQEGVCLPHLDDVHSFDHTLHSLMLQK
jgi:hypothetical protein